MTEFIGIDMHGRKLVGVASDKGSVIIQVVGDDDECIISVHVESLLALAKWLEHVADQPDGEEEADEAYREH